MSEIQADYDSPWKEAIELYFAEFMALFFPDAYVDIDWEKGYEFLDKELQQVVRDAELGTRLADKLVKVWRLTGEESWVLVHLEVQSQVELDFAKRMYIYNYRLFDRYERQIVSLAVLGDEQRTWRPHCYQYSLWGCQVSLQFPIVKLLDYELQWENLETNNNPFAIVVMAHLKTKATRNQPQERLQWKLTLIRSLYERGYTKNEVLQLFRLIQWMMVLPKELELSFQEEQSRYEEEKRMPYLMSIERDAIMKNLQENVIEILETRFAEIPQSLIDSINQISDLTELKPLLKASITIQSVADFQDFIAHKTIDN